MPVPETKIFYAILVAAGMILLIFLLFLISILRQYRKNRSLYKQKLVAEINAAETERKVLAQDLHDDIGPLLSAVRMHIRKGSPESIEKAVQYTDDVISQIREVSHKLLPVSLSRAGLPEAVKEYSSTVSAAGDMQIKCICDSGVSAGENDIHIYRIIHEIIHNSLKHAKATMMTIRIVPEKNNLVIEAGDNGIGTELHKLKKDGLGLMNIASRVELMHGDMYIDTAPGKGMQYRIEIPLRTLPEETMNDESRINNLS